MGSVKTIPLTGGRVATVDAADYPALARFKWWALCNRRNVYAVRQVGRSTVYMHRTIAGARSGQSVDHADHDGLNNRRSNLRKCSQRDNCRNARTQLRPKSSRYKGVRWSKKLLRWEAYINAGKRGARGKSAYKYIGLFDSDREAARAYDRAAAEHFGEFAALNFPDKKAG